MKRSRAWGLIVLIGVVAAGAAWWWKGRTPADDAAAAEAKDAAPVVTVKSEVPRVRDVARTLDAIADVAAGQTAGLSFARAGQVTSLSVLVGDRVAKGATLAELTPDPATRQAYQQAVDAAALAQREWDRQKQLAASRLATQSQVDAAEKAWRDAQGAVKALDEQGGGTSSSKLVAPWEGVVASVAVAQGDRIQAGAPVLQLGRADTLRVAIGIEPSQRGRVHAGTHVSLSPLDGTIADSVPLELTVSEMQAAIDPKTQMVDAIALVAHGFAGQLAAGMKMRARVQAGSVSAVAVARNAVLTDEKGDYVFQVAGGKAHRVAVTRQVDNGTLVAIAGLKDLKSPVVVEGNYELQDGMAVKDAAP